MVLPIIAHRTPPAERDLSGNLLEVLARYEQELTQDERNAVGRALEAGKEEEEIKKILAIGLITSTAPSE